MNATYDTNRNSSIYLNNAQRPTAEPILNISKRDFATAIGSKPSTPTHFTIIQHEFGVTKFHHFPARFQSRATWARRRIKLQSPISKGYKFHVLHSKSYTLTGLSFTTSGFFVTASYHKSHRVLLAANEPNRFMWRVMRAHLSDLKFATRFGCMLWKFLECMSSVLEMNFFRGYGVYEFNGFRLG